MTHQNLVLTEKAIKSHCKRLQKELKKYNKDLSLGESQNLLSKILGFNDWNHLNTILNKKTYVSEIPSYNLIDSLEQPKIFKSINSNDSINILTNLINNKETNFLYGRAISLISAIMPVLIYMRDQKEILLDSVCIQHYLILNNIVKLYVIRRDFPGEIHSNLHDYLHSLQGFQSTNTDYQCVAVVEQHDSAKMQFFFILKHLEKIEKNNFIIADKNWFNRAEGKINDNSLLSFGKQQRDVNNTYLKLNNNLISFDFLEDSWIDMPEYEEFVLSLERKNKLNSIRVFDLVIEITKLISPYKRKKMELLLNNILEHYSFASEISKQIQNNLNFGLNSIILQGEKDKLFLENIKEMIKPLVFVISKSDLIRKSIQLFLGESDIVGDYYKDIYFETTEEFSCYTKNNSKRPKLIICDESIELKNIYCPIVYLTEESKSEIFYKTMSKLFFAKKFIEAIKEIKKYINENNGNVDLKYWELLLSLYQETSAREDFEKTALSFSNKFNLKEEFSFDSYSFIPEKNKTYFLSKPFSKEDLFKIIHYAESHN